MAGIKGGLLCIFIFLSAERVKIVPVDLPSILLQDANMKLPLVLRFLKRTALVILGHL